MVCGGCLAMRERGGGQECADPVQYARTAAICKVDFLGANNR